MDFNALVEGFVREEEEADEDEDEDEPRTAAAAGGATTTATAAAANEGARANQVEEAAPGAGDRRRRTRARSDDDVSELEAQTHGGLGGIRPGDEGEEAAAKEETQAQIRPHAESAGRRFSRHRARGEGCRR